MGRPRYYWYGIVRQMIMATDKVKDERSMQSAIFTNAMNDAMEETLKLPNGKLRVKAVGEVLIKKTKTIEGVAQEVHYEHRTVQGWINSFVNLVGKKAGY